MKTKQMHLKMNINLRTIVMKLMLNLMTNIYDNTLILNIY